MNQMKVEHIDHMGNDDSVVNAARVSFAKQSDQYTDEQNARLIKYLARHNHWTPFAHAFVTLRFKAPIAIHAQCVKHQIGFAMNTVSRRYVSDEPELFIPEFRLAPDGSIKQGSGDIHPDNEHYQAYYIRRCNMMVRAYLELIDMKVAPEQARFILPQGVMTEWVWSGSLQAWARFYNQRSYSKAQKEIQFLAHEVDRIVGALFPVSWEALTYSIDSIGAEPTTSMTTPTEPNDK